MEYTGRYCLKKPGVEDFYNVQDQNANMDAIDAALSEKCECRVVAARERDPTKPDYGLVGGGDTEAVALETGPYTGTAEVSLTVEGTEYDAKNIRTDGAKAPDGIIIIRKMEETQNG